MHVIYTSSHPHRSGQGPPAGNSFDEAFSDDEDQGKNKFSSKLSTEAK